MTSIKASKPTTARNIDLQFDTRDMLPFYSKLVDGIYSRPVVVTFLFPSKYCRKLNAVSPSSSSRRARSPSPSALEESAIFSSPASPSTQYQQGENEDDILSTDFYQEKIQNALSQSKISKYFVVKVSDVVESRDASYKVIVRDFKDLLKELKDGYGDSKAVEDYFKPSSLRWWISYIDQVLLVFDRPSGKLAALVDRGKITQRVKRKMDHHQWMLGQLNEKNAVNDNIRGSVIDSNLNLTNAMEEMMSRFEEFPDEKVNDIEQNSTSFAGEQEDVHLEESIDDNAVIGRDEPKPAPLIDQMKAQEVQEEIDNNSAMQPPGSITANILDDISLSQTANGPDELPISSDSNGADKSSAKKIAKKKSHTADSKLRSSADSNKSRGRSSQDSNKQQQQSKVNTPSNLQGDSVASPSRHSSAIARSRSRQSSSSPSNVDKKDNSIRNSTSLPAINTQSSHSSSIVQQQQPCSLAQERTNQLLEGAYGRAATTSLFPAKCFREEEQLRQSILASLPGHKAKKRVSTAASSASGVSRSHEGKLPSIVDKSSSPKGSVFEYPVASFSERSSDNRVSGEESLTISDIAQIVADRVDAEIRLANENNAGLDQELAGIQEQQYDKDDPRHDPYRQVAIATSFLSIERPVSPQQRPVSPYAEELKQLKGSKKVAAEIIHRARKSVSGSIKFQVRKISYSEKKLLDSPFAKKIYFEPVEDPAKNVLLDSTQTTTDSTHISPGAGSTPLTSPEKPVHNDAIQEEASQTSAAPKSSSKKQSNLRASTSSTAHKTGRSSQKGSANTGSENKPTASHRKTQKDAAPEEKKEEISPVDVTPAVEEPRVATEGKTTKIVYLETDDSVLVDEQLDVTIAYLAPEAPACSEANTLAQEEALLEEHRLFAEQEQQQQQHQQRSDVPISTAEEAQAMDDIAYFENQGEDQQVDASTGYYNYSEQAGDGQQQYYEQSAEAYPDSQQHDYSAEQQVYGADGQATYDHSTAGAQPTWDGQEWQPAAEGQEYSDQAYDPAYYSNTGEGQYDAQQQQQQQQWHDEGQQTHENHQSSISHPE